MAVRRMLIAGRYRLLEPVGSGGMGRVWLARDEMLDRDVAVKEFVPPTWMTDEEQARLRTRTLREARSAARLNHPHVVRIYDVVHADDLPWIVMEYVPSRSLYQVVSEDGPFAPVAAARIGLDVLEAITAAHRAGVLHRDVKPHNVLIGHDGRVVLTDFGLATFVDDGSVTGPGMVVGSPQYVSPERARDGASTVESDLWSFGATLYAAVEGRSPFARDSAMATLMALATDEADPPVRAGPLAPVLAGLLRREPVERLTGAEVAERLRMIVAEAEVVPPAPRPAGTTFGRAVVPGPRKPPADRPDPAKAPAEAQAESAGGGLSPTLAAALPGGSHPSAPAVELREGHPSERVIPAQRGVPTQLGVPAQPGVPAQQGARAGSGPARSRRRLLAGLVVALLAGAGAATGLAMRGDGDNSQAQPGAIGSTPSVATSSGAGGGSGGFSPVNCASPAPSGLPRTPVAGAAKLRDGWALYPGWSYFSDAGFHIAVPDGWTYQTIGTTICFRDPSNIRILSIDPERSPQGDPVLACRKEVSRLRAAGDLKNYTQLRIDRVPGLARAADWEYTYDGRDGERIHAMTRWRAANDGKAYAIGLMTLDLDWPGNFEKWGMIQSTFFTDS
ncbi:serine/threonine protein kinase [Actinoplanes sp. ATCC 53533]|uniref:serine/threonine-protein kinase n=1 Tax=Actinoplanes sp. ATCC 53533 TaxID=1288362 RepID=UPI000F787A77|nr:serine/threonine-protein kinase [Actinoplanes sp. ATCC 53533]RSM49821.1 serine/threonine protein kinase [Actinoplanes sp. ATCC 53533]